MLAEQFSGFMDQVFGAWDLDPASDRGRRCLAAWDRRFAGESPHVFGAALERAINAHPQRLPTLGQMWALVQDAKAERRRNEAGRRDEPPVTPAERRQIAEQLAHEAAARASRLGRQDDWCRYFEALADGYSRNAERTSQGLPRLPRPRLGQLLRGIGA